MYKYIKYALFLVLFSVPALADEIDDLIRKLKEPDLFLQCETIEKLGRTKDRRATKALIELLAGSDSRDSRAAATTVDAQKVIAGLAARIVAKAGKAVAGGDKNRPAARPLEEKALEQCLAELRSGKNYDMRKAAETLEKSRDERGAEPLMQAFKVGQDSSRPAIMEALVAIGDQRAAQIFYTALTTDTFLKDKALESLENLGGGETVLYLNKAAAYEDDEISRAAEKILSGFGPNHGLEPLLELLKHPEAKVQALAAQALREIDDPMALLDLEEYNKRAAAGDLSQTAPESVLLKQYDVKLKAIAVLGQMQDLSGVRPLTALVTSQSELDMYRCAAGRALCKFNTDSIIKKIERDLFVSDRIKNIAALEALGYIGDDKAVAALGQALQNKFMVQETLEALVISQNPVAVKYLANMMNEPFIGDDVAGALLKFNSPVAFKQLLDSFEDLRPHIMRNIVEYCSKNITPETVELLKKASNNPFVGREAVEALRKSGN